MGELDNLKIYGETSVGWDAATPPNETTDDDGRPYIPELKTGQVDPRAPRTRRYDDPDVQRLREVFRAKNGINGLEICEPHEVERATRIFYRDGFVVVNNLLDAERLSTWREASARVLRQILEIKGEGGRKYLTETGRLPHRYSYGTASASRELLHDPVWASMIDLPTTTPILTRIFGTADYFVRGAGGDLCLPGAVEYQGLHADTRDTFEITPARREQAERVGIRLNKIPGTEELDAATSQPHPRAHAAACDDQLPDERLHLGERTHPPDRRHAGPRAQAADASGRAGMDAALDARRRQGGRRRVP